MALSIMPEQHPRWVEKDSPSSSLRTTSERSMSATSAVLDADIFISILNVLQKIDTKMGHQGKRLDILETTSPSSIGDTTLANDSPMSTNSQAQETQLANDQPVITRSEYEDDVKEYACSLLKMRWQFDDTTSNVGLEHPDIVFQIGHAAKGRKDSGTWTQHNHFPCEDDGHWGLMYSEDLLGSKMSLGLPRILDNSSMPPCHHLKSLPWRRLGLKQKTSATYRLRQF